MQKALKSTGNLLGYCAMWTKLNQKYGLSSKFNFMFVALLLLQIQITVAIIVIITFMLQIEGFF